jgi:hypothetical protein
MYNIQNYVVFGLCPSIGIIKNRVFRKPDLFPSSSKWETSTLLGPLERANLNHWTHHFSITMAIKIPEIRLFRREITGTYAINL